MKGYLFSNNYDNCIIIWPIALKLRIHEDIRLAMYLHVSELGCYCTCAHIRIVHRSRERLNRLRSNLIHHWGPVSRVACKSQLEPTLHVRTCRVTVPDLKNGWADCFQIWYTDRDRLVGYRASQLKHTHTVPHVQGSTSRSFVCRPKRRLTGLSCYERARSAKRVFSVYTKKALLLKHIDDNLGTCHVLSQGCQNCSACHSSAITGPITLKFDM